MAPPKDKWDEVESDGEVVGIVVATRIAPKKKWDDEEDEEVLDSWDAADDSEEELKKESAKKAAAEKAAAEAAANRKSKTQQIAEKQAERQAEKQAALERAEREREEMENETPAERKERERLQQIKSDLAHAQDLFGNVGIGASSGIGTREKRITIADPDDPSKNIDLSTLPIFNPTMKDEFMELREVLVPLLVANTKGTYYPLFLQDFTRQLSKDMPSEQIRKVASGLTTLTNEKQKGEKAAGGGGKKKAVKKTVLAASGKEMDKLDTTDYYHADNTYDDDGFMFGTGGIETREKKVTVTVTVTDDPSKNTDLNTLPTFREKKTTMMDPDDPSKNIDLSTLPIFNPTMKDEFLELREVLVPLLVANMKEAYYPLFLQDFTRQLSKDMPSERIRKVASGLTTLANEKQKDEKAAEKGGKKKAVKKAALAVSGKDIDKPDTTDYYHADNTYDDDDFM